MKFCEKNIHLIYFFQKFIKHSKNYQNLSLNSNFKAQIYKVFESVYGFAMFFLCQATGLRARVFFMRGLRTFLFFPISFLLLIGFQKTIAILKHHFFSNFYRSWDFLIYAFVWPVGSRAWKIITVLKFTIIYIILYNFFF